MAGSWDRARTIGGAICLIGAPLALLVGDLLQIDLIEYDDNQKLVDNVFDHPDRWLAANALLMVGFTLLVGAVLVIAARLRNDADGYGLVGGSLTVIGLMAGAGIVTIQGPVLWLIAHQDQNPEAMLELLDAGENSGRFFAIYLVGLAFFVGTLLLAAGLWRGRAAPVGVPVLLAIGVVLAFVGGPLEVVAASIVGDVALLAGLGWLGWLVLREGGVVGEGSAPG